MKRASDFGSVRVMKEGFARLRLRGAWHHAISFSSQNLNKLYQRLSILIFFKKLGGDRSLHLAGDRACYMELEDAQGQKSDAEASFELCEQEQLVGQRVQLTRVPTPILAMSCQGDPECTQRDTVNLITVAEVVSSDRQSNSAAALVSQLYERFPAPSEDTPLSADAAIIAQDREVLTQFFDDELTDLILADRACVAQNEGVCRLGFDPLWNSQDPTAYEFEVHPTEQPQVVEVQVNAPGSAEKIKLEYTLVQEGDAWRITDISYPEGVTLHEILDTFPPE